MSGQLPGVKKAQGPHAHAPVRMVGPAPEQAGAVVVAVHGRGASAADILGLFGELGVENCAAIAPEAAGNVWYPYSFLAPLENNQPYLDSALEMLAGIVDDLLARGVPSTRILFLGFSQGGCLSTEFVARHPRRYGGVMGLTGGLIGPAGTPRNYAGSLDGTPVFLGTSDPDPHVPLARVQETRDVLRAMGAVVELRAYPGMPHTVNEEEIAVCREMVERVVRGGKGGSPGKGEI